MSSAGRRIQCHYHVAVFFFLSFFLRLFRLFSRMYFALFPTYSVHRLLFSKISFPFYFGADRCRFTQYNVLIQFLVVLTHLLMHVFGRSVHKNRKIDKKNVQNDMFCHCAI